jgi:predicted DNA-binding protein
MAKAPKPADKCVRRRLYSLYPEQISKLEQLAKRAKVPQSQYLRELIDVAFAEKFETVRYGAAN